MANYVYRCPDCGNECVVAHSMHDNPDVWCGECRGKMRRRPQKVGVNWGGLPPSKGFIHPKIRQHIEDAPRRREEG